MAGHSRLKDGGASARLCPGHPRLSSFQHRKNVDARHKAGHDAVDLMSDAELPIDPVPIQCADDARPDPVTHAVRSRAPRHQRSSLGRRSAGPDTRGPSSVPLHPGRPGPGPLGVARLSLARLGFGFNDRRPFDIFRSFGSRRRFHDSRSLRGLGRSGHCRGLATSERKAPITSLRGGGCQNKSCNQNEFTHVQISP
jgi:hypothetical protein